MKFELFSRVALKTDLPEESPRRGDIATIVEFHQGWPGQELGSSLEVFNAVGDTIAVIPLRESQIESLSAREPSMSARSLPLPLESDPREAAFQAKSLHDYKFWSPAARVDNVFGDRNPVCSCVGMENCQS